VSKARPYLSRAPFRHFQGKFMGLPENIGLEGKICQGQTL